MEWVINGVVGVVVLGLICFLVSRLFSAEEKTGNEKSLPPPQSVKSPTPASTSLHRSTRLSATAMLDRVRDLRARNARWREISAQLDPSNDATVQQLLVYLQSDGLQFAPSDALRAIELACANLVGTPGADAIAVLQKVLGQSVVPTPVIQPRSSRITAAETLSRVRDLSTRNTQWREIETRLNPGNDPAVQQLLTELRNNGLQFAPRDGIRRLEIACEDLVAIPGADLITVLRKALGYRDPLDKFE